MTRLITARRHVVTLLVALLALAAPAAAQASAKVSLLDAESQLICVSCHEPLELAQSPQAQREKDYVAGLVARGYGMRQIKAAMVAQYGIAVLGRPPAHGFNLTVYVLPPAVLAIGIAFLIFTLPRWRARSRRAAEAAAAAAAGASAPSKPTLSKAESDRLDAELGRFI